MKLIFHTDYYQLIDKLQIFVNNSSVNIKLSKTQLSKTVKTGESLGTVLGPLPKAGLPLMKKVLKPLAKSVLIPLGLTEAASAADAGIYKKSQDQENNINNVKRRNKRHYENSQVS